jgi:hypothetical protein
MNTCISKMSHRLICHSGLDPGSGVLARTPVFSGRNTMKTYFMAASVLLLLKKHIDCHL